MYLSIYLYVHLVHVYTCSAVHVSLFKAPNVPINIHIGTFGTCIYVVWYMYLCLKAPMYLSIYIYVHLVHVYICSVVHVSLLKGPNVPINIHICTFGTCIYM